MKKCLFTMYALILFLYFSGTAMPENPPGESPALGYNRLTQEALESGIQSGKFSLLDIRRMGLTIFATPFNKLDGYGDGPMDPSDPTTPGHRPTLQGNGTFLRVNGLDAQSCLECHSILSTATIPPKFGVGGVGTVSSNVMAGPKLIDVSDSLGAGMASFNGRFINPPFLFGSGGVELLAKEMTAELQAIKQNAISNYRGMWVKLMSKGVNFGEIQCFENGNCDTSRIEGIDPDLVVRPFGRKGGFITTRQFDIRAFEFHQGMQAVESVGRDVDADGDGVVNELLVGELSALAIFNTTLEIPYQETLSNRAKRGFEHFVRIGCADCHKPYLDTNSSILTYSYPEVETEPFVNVYFQVNLRKAPTHFEPNDIGGVRVPLFSDLKRHNMGDELAESAGSNLDNMFITARLWGVADTAPYMHDGRALTLTDAILMHGGEAKVARDKFFELPTRKKVELLTFLRSLRTPRHVGRDLTEK